MPELSDALRARWALATPSVSLPLAATVHDAALRDVARVRFVGHVDVSEEGVRFGPDTDYRVSLPEELHDAPAIAVEVHVKPPPPGTGGKTQTLATSGHPPFGLIVDAKASGWLPRASMRLRYATERGYKTGWVYVRATRPLPGDRFSTVIAAFTGSELVLLVEGEVVARRLLDDARLAPTRAYRTGAAARVGADVDGDQAFHGWIGGVQVYAGVPAPIVDALGDAAAKGIGALDSARLTAAVAAKELGKRVGVSVVTPSRVYQAYVGGAAGWTADLGGWVVTGPIGDYWRSGDNPTIYGDPVGGARRLWPGATQRNFEHGIVFYSAETGAHGLHGEVLQAFLSTPNALDVLGLPTSEPELWVNGSTITRFQRGAIVAPLFGTALAVYGGIGARYLVRADAERLGLPQSPEKDAADEAGKAIGRVQVFERGTIWWSAQTGARIVAGVALTAYRAAGAAASPVGLPVAEEHVVGLTGWSAVGFQRGVLVWRGGTAPTFVRDLEFVLDSMRQAKAIDDGWTDDDAEFYTFVTLSANGVDLIAGQRFPDGHAGSALAYNVVKTIPIRHDTVVSLSVSVNDWDAGSEDEWLANFRRNFDLADVVSVLANGGQRIYDDLPVNEHNSDLSDGAAILHRVALRQPSVPVNSAVLRQQGWWQFQNFTTSALTTAQYMAAFIDGDWSSTPPGDVEKAAAGGNCFGMSATAMLALNGLSVLREPIYPNAQTPTITDLVNVQQARQMGAPMRTWRAAQRGEASAATFGRVEAALRSGPAALLCMNDSATKVGHCVMAYRVERAGAATGPAPRAGMGTFLGRIWVADPNRPWRAGLPVDQTYVDFWDDRTFAMFDLASGVPVIPTDGAKKTLTYASPRNAGTADAYDLGMEMFPLAVVSTDQRYHMGVLYDWAEWMVYGAVTGDVAVAQLTVGGEGLMGRLPSGRPVVRGEGAGGVVWLPPTESGERVPFEIFAPRAPSVPIELELQGPGRAEVHVQGPRVTLGASGTAGARDVLHLAGLRTAAPTLRYTASGAGDVRLACTVRSDPSGRPPRRFEATLPTGAGTTASLAIDPATGGVLLAGGRAATVELSWSEGVGGTAVQRLAAIAVPGGDERVLVTATGPLADVVRLSADDTVLGRVKVPLRTV